MGRMNVYAEPGKHDYTEPELAGWFDSSKADHWDDSDYNGNGSLGAAAVPASTAPPRAGGSATYGAAGKASPATHAPSPPRSAPANGCSATTRTPP